MELVKVENNEIIVAEEVVKEIVEFKKKALEIELKEKELKESLLEAMEKYGIVKWTSPNEELEVTYRKPSTRTILDSKRLKEELPDIYEEYSKVSEVASSVTITVK
jgi:predicted phage-related endonuclease